MMNSIPWKMLEKHHASIAHFHMRDLFLNDPQRFSKFSLSVDDLMFDYSKNRIIEETLPLLFSLANEKHLKVQIEKLFSGAPLNITENCPALHTALRQPTHLPLHVQNHNVMTSIHRVLVQMKQFTECVRSGQRLGYTHQPITDIINLGIGGSYVGPLMGTEALQPYHCSSLRCHFVSNVDGSSLATLLSKLDPATTLFIISSKSFSTLETLTNTDTAQKWIGQAFGTPAAFDQHFIAVTAHRERAIARGIAAENIFDLWEWVGGRTSVWSAIGLPIALLIGMENFQQFLAGAYAIDQHFRHTPFEKNIPVIMGLLGIWYNHFFGATSHAVIPYDASLKHLPTYLQQLEMESNGKHVDREGLPLKTPTAPIVWGDVGCNVQHTFFQLLYQGTHLIPSDFITTLKPHHHWTHHHETLFALCLSQSQALLQGKSEEALIKELISQGVSLEKAKQLAPHQVIRGNQPSNTLLLSQLTPYTLGSLLALYEHKVFVESVIWNINPFDQWGVELGKQLSVPLVADVQRKQISQPYDSSTAGLLKHYCEYNKIAEKITLSILSEER